MKSKKGIAKNLILYSILAVLIVCFLSIYLYVINNSGLVDFTPIDRIVYNFVCDVFKPFEKFLLFITYFGKEVIIIFSIVLIFANLISLKFRKVNNIKVFMINTFVPAVAALGTYLVNDMLKEVIKRQRPICNNIITETSYSFPSGHSSTSACFYFILLIIICKLLNNYIDNNSEKKKVVLIKILKIFLMVAMTLMPFIIALSRIYLGVHYFTDIVCGLIFGSIIFIILYNIYDNLIKKI